MSFIFKKHGLDRPAGCPTVGPDDWLFSVHLAGKLIGYTWRESLRVPGMCGWVSTETWKASYGYGAQSPVQLLRRNIKRPKACFTSRPDAARAIMKCLSEN